MALPLLCSIIIFSPGVVTKHVFYEGDFMLGSLFPIHKHQQDVEGESSCGEIQREDGIQPLEAMLFILDEINRDPRILPGISLGMIAYDSCDDPIYAVEQSVKFLRGFMSRKANLSSPTTSKDRIVGMIGPQTSAVSVQLANFGRIFDVIQISYLSTSVKLCNHVEFPYFFRTVPSDVHQAKAIAELFNEFKWNYANIVHSDSEYGEMGYQALKEQMSLRDICLTQPIVIINKYFVAEDYRNIIRRLMETKLSRIVIVFCDRVPAGKLLEAALDLNVYDYFLWVGSDAWASRESVVKGREAAVRGAIAVQPLRRPLPGFDRYFKNLFINENVRNPWFEEYLKVYHNCSAGNCSHGLNQIEEQQLYVHFVRDAVYAFAHALNNLLIDKCGGSIILCKDFWDSVHIELRKYLSEVKFKDVDGNDFRFYGIHEQGAYFRHDGPPRYSIINFQNRNGTYQWKTIGTYVNGLIRLNSELLNFTDFGELSQCHREPCAPYEIKVPSTKDGCCWTCKQCHTSEYKRSDFECATCPLGTQSSIRDNRTSCKEIPEIFMNYGDRWAIASMCFATVGIAMTAITCYIFWVYWETPVVKASGRELSLILLFGTFLSFTATFVIVSKPTSWSCGVMRFAIGFCYTVCYSAVVTKTSRVARIFRRSASNDSPKWTSPLSSMLISTGLVSIEVIINVVWLLIEPPETVHVVSVLGKRILVCSGVDDTFLAGLIYPFILSIGATLYAFKTRKCPGGFNETRFIFFANTVTSIHWFAYVPLYLASTDHHIRAVILAFSLCLSGIVQLGCLLFPKLYIVVFKPEKNTRDAVMTRRYHLSTSSHSMPMPHSTSMVLSGEHCHQDTDHLNTGEHRRLTWSHTLHAVEDGSTNQLPQGRTRSTSISRSTQTGGGNSTEAESKRSITFIVDPSDDELEVS